MTARAHRDLLREPMSVYELHFGSWRPGLGYREAAEAPHRLRPGDRLHPRRVHAARGAPLRGLVGLPGHRLLRADESFRHPDDLRYLIDRLHAAGIGVILDWVPGHFPKDAFALARFDGEALYEHPDPRRGEHRDWGTLVFDYGRNEVRNFLVANALYWFEEFHVDGLRVTPSPRCSTSTIRASRRLGAEHPRGRENLEAIRFLQEANATAYRRYPGIAMIAEESTSFPGVTAPTDHGGLGFGLKWNMGWMNDGLAYIGRDPLYRAHHEGELSFSFVYAFSENFVLPISHDEVVHGKGSLFSRMPATTGRSARTSAPSSRTCGPTPASSSCSWARSSVRSRNGRSRDRSTGGSSTSRHIGSCSTSSRRSTASIARTAPVGPGARRQRIHADRSARVEPQCARLRTARRRDIVVAVCNFGGEPLHDYPLELPEPGVWQEILNTDAHEFGGSGVGNLGVVHADTDRRARLTLPPLGVLWLRHERGRAIPTPTHD